ncbi:MAG TPA: hypothetical protein DCY10_05565 [Clostridiales bacterium]|nr:hypothetical protein [Clostridiales bacterium]
MTNNHSLRFPALSVAQTQRLLNGVSTLPLSIGAASRIRSRVLQKVAPKSLARKRLRKTLVSIAACLLAIVIFFTAFPKAALAVSEFFERVFTPSRYMNEDPSTRTAVPSIDEAIAAAAPQDGDYTITLMPDLPNAQEFVDFRAQNGYDAFSEENWGWLRDIRPEIAEVLYDGNQLIWNTNLYTTNEHVRVFMEGFGIHSGSKLSVDALMDDVTYTVAGDPTVYELHVSGHGITPIFDETALASADHVVLYSDFYIDSAQPLPDGVLTITQNIRVCENDAMDYGATVAIITHTFTFDTTKGNTPSAEGAETLIPLSGEVYLSLMIREKDSEGQTKSWRMETRKISLDGVALKATYQYLSTGIMVHITIAEKPSDWTDSMVEGLMFMTWQTIFGDYRSPGIANNLYVDGVLLFETPTPESWSNRELAYILPIFPDQYANAQSVVMKLSLYHYVTLCGTDQLAGEVYEVPENSDVNMEAVVEGVPLTEITVPLPKN